jgi:hypothetical protein
MYTCLAYSILLIYVWFYANDGYYTYVPKRYRWKYRKKAYLAYLKAWWRGKKQTTWAWFKYWWMKRHLYRTSKRRKKWDPIGFIRADMEMLAQEAILAHQAKVRDTQADFVIDSDSKRVGVDNRASAYISGDISDFDGPMVDSHKVVRGFGGIRVKGIQQGTAVLRIEDDEGRVHRIKLRNSYYVPGSKDRLLSPQHFAQQMKRQSKGPATETTDDEKVVLTWGRDGCYKLTVPLDPVTNVATLRTAPSYENFMAYCAEAGHDEAQESTEPIAFDAALVSDDEDDDHETDATDSGLNAWPYCQPTGGGDNEGKEWQDNQLPNTIPNARDSTNIEQESVEIPGRNEEAELLDYHARYNHVSFTKLRRMAMQGQIPRRLTRCRVPVCAACMYGKATKRPWRSKKPNNREESFKPTKPGQVVSVDQLKSPTPGFIAQLTGKLTTGRYRYATVFVDGFSGRGYVHLQKSQSADETMEAKRAFERKCLQDGVRVQHYHADNGVFRARAWTDDCHASGQGMTFAGVDAHHQNGRAEARIRRLQEQTRTTLLHAMRKWPQEVSPNLWPYALRMASESINATPNLSDEQSRSPDQLFSGSDVTSNPKHWHHFGSPVFVLDQALRGSTRIHHKWKDRSKIGIYLGRSPQHARSVALVLNPETGLVSPQFHVKHDGAFQTVPQLYGPKQESKWQVKAGLVQVKDKGDNKATERNIMQSADVNFDPMRVPEGASGQTRPTADLARSPGGEEAEDPETKDRREPSAGDGTGGEGSDQQATAQPSEHSEAKQQPTRASSRTRRPVQRLVEAMRAEIEQETNSSNEIFSYQAMYPRDDTMGDAINQADSLLAMKATADPDTLYLHEARRQPDWSHFAEAMQLEIDQQVSTGLYTIVRRTEAPEGATVLPAVWQLRRKRDQRTGNIKKYKARCNINGSRMRYGEHYEQTYAPVAGWTAIRMILALVLLNGWHTAQLDYVLAYPQAPAVRDLYMEVPKGFTLDGVDNPSDYVLKVNKNTYGGKDAGRTWFQYLRKKLLKLGFEQSEHDECMFYKGQMVYVLYTDDSILAGPDKEDINATIELLRTELDITVEGDLTDFLGVNIDRRSDGSIKLSQPHLIDQVIKDLNLDQESTKPKPTPAASSKLLSRHEDSRPFDNHFNYRSVIGKLHYLVAGSRSEMAYAVHQCARFAQEPKMEHAQAVKWIGRYLKATRNDGTILRPDGSKSLEVYVDADFAGNWDPKLAGKDRSTARSRHGYYICYGGMPIAWKSQLQQEIALAITHYCVDGK